MNVGTTWLALPRGKMRSDQRKSLTYLIDLDYYGLVWLSQVNSVIRSDKRGDDLDHGIPFEEAVVANRWSDGVLCRQ